jgi:hypothetical protein
MNWILELPATSPVAHAIGVIALVCVAGMALGSLKIRGVGLGTAGVLFAGILAGHFSKPIDHHTLEFLKEFGLILFVFTIGLQLGPGFFASVRKQGMQLNAIAACVVLLGAALAIALGWLLEIDFAGRYWREAMSWYGATGPVDLDSHCLAYSLHGASGLYVMINAFWEPVRFHIQQPGPWNCVVDTSRQDFATPAVAGLNYEVTPRSVVVMERA